MKKNFYILQIEENEELAIQIEKMIMEKHEFVTKSKIIKSGEEAIEEIQKKLPDFILLNQKLSGMTGLEMLEKCNDLKIKLPQVVVIVDENISREVEDRFYELGVKYICKRPLNDIQKKYVLYYIVTSYKTSTKIAQEDMLRLVCKQTEPLLKNLKNGRTPYQVSLVGFMLKYLIENDLEYSKESKKEIYEHLKEKYSLDNRIINEIRKIIEEIIEENYIGNEIAKKERYDINKDEIQEKFFNESKKNVLKDIIAESN